MTRRAHSRVQAPTSIIHAVVAKPNLDVASRLKQAFRLQRLARQHRKLSWFYLEHNLFEEADKARIVMLEHLRDASDQWRAVLSGKR